MRGLAILLLFALLTGGPVLAQDCGAPLAAGPWFSTVTPSEAGNDSSRSHLYAAGCSAIGPGRPPIQLGAAGNLSGVYNVVTRAPGELYVLGGAFGLIDAGNGPFVAGLEAGSLKERWRTRLPGLTSADWNYPGALGVHQNGDLYVVYGPHIARLDPASGAVKAHTDLPVNQPASDVAYNGFVILRDGRIATKSIHRLPGCKLPDFQAFLGCPTAGMAASTLALVDPDNLAVLQTEIMPEHTRFRVTATLLDGNEYLYLPGDAFIHRYRYSAGRLSRDAGWMPRYLSPGQMPATASAGFGDWLVVQTNGIPSPVPMSIVAVSQRDASRIHRFEPFAQDSAGGSFIPSMPTVDPVNNRVYSFDGFVGKVAALDFAPDRGFKLAWTQDQRSFAFSALVGPPEARQWVGTDLNDWLTRAAFGLLGYDNRLRLIGRSTPRPEDLVWRDANSGRELGRAPKAGAVAGSVPVPGFDGEFLLPDLDGRALVAFGAVAGRPNR